jgi:hypothetical protein
VKVASNEVVLMENDGVVVEWCVGRSPSIQPR